MPWLWAAVWFTLPISMRGNSAVLLLFGLGAVINAFYDRPVFNRRQVVMAAFFILFFAWHSVSLLFDPAQHEVLKSLERKASLVAIPVAMILITGVKWETEKWAIRGFLAGLSITGIHMTTTAMFRLLSGEPLSEVIYHGFTGPYTLGAIYYSWYLAAALLYLAFRQPELFIRKIRPGLIAFFLLLLLLCASKLFIIITLPVLIYALISRQRYKSWKYRHAGIVFIVILMAAGLIPFAGRFSELKNTDFSVVSQQEFSYDTPFNGLTFRLLLWRFAGEILDERQAWLNGTGIASRQDILDSTYMKYGVYTGNPDLGDTGYLHYNFHCQYLETLVGTGVPGLILLLALIMLIFIEKKDNFLFPVSVYLLTIAFLLTESVLERQHGIVFFTLIWSWRNYKF